MNTRSTIPEKWIRWGKQAPARDPADVVNYAGNAASGLRYESSSGQPIALDPQTVTHLFDTLRRHNPLWDGGPDEGGDSDTDRLRQWFAAHVADAWDLADVDSESMRLLRVLHAEGLELPQIRAMDAVQAVVGRDVIFFDRRNVCRARLTAAKRDDAPSDDPEASVRLEFEVSPLPDVEWSHGTPFTVNAGAEFLRLQRGYFAISMTNIVVITAPALVDDVRRLLSDWTGTAAARIRPIRDRIERRPSESPDS